MDSMKNNKWSGKILIKRYDYMSNNIDSKKDIYIISLISNISFDPYFVPLITKQFSDLNNCCPAISPIPYEEYNLLEHRDSFSKADLIVVWLNFESLFPNAWNNLYAQTATDQPIVDNIAALCNKLYSDIQIYSNAQILWFLFEDYDIQLPIVKGCQYDALIDKINLKISDAITYGVTYINLKRLIAEVGVANAYDPKNKYRWNAPYSKTIIETAVKEIHKQYLIETGITKKCLILDCDNVLWGGILSEDGIENIKLGGGFGRAYQNFQRFILSLYYHGVILAICSKNDLSDVMTMFREHSEMILKEELIACFQVNWGNKLDNIKRIAEILNISLDSLVFVDDSPIEIEAARAMLPEVTTILYERDTVYAQLSCFNLKSNVNIADVEKRNETYRTKQSREALKSQYDSYSDYINALDIKIDIHVTAPIEFSRISELTQRTNKCTNGIRYTVAEIKERVASKKVKLYSLSVADRFSDLGLVGVIEVEGDTLTLFSLSCRALGRKIEDKILEFIAKNHEIIKIDFRSTGKNEDIKTLLQKAFPNAVVTNGEILLER